MDLQKKCAWVIKW